MEAIKKVLEREDYASPADFAAAREELARQDEAIVKLVDAVNQLALLVEELAARRNATTIRIGFQQELRNIRDDIAELIPE